MEKNKAKAKAEKAKAKRKRRIKREDPEKRERLKYYCILGGILLLVLACVAAGMYLYLKSVANDNKEEYRTQLQTGMENAKNICVETLESIEADQEYIDGINMRYENAMAQTDILQQYYLVDGMLDYAYSSLLNIYNIKAAEAANNNRAAPNYDDEIAVINDTKTELAAVKEQISAIDLTKYY